MTGADVAHWFYGRGGDVRTVAANVMAEICEQVAAKINASDPESAARLRGAANAYHLCFEEDRKALGARENQ